MECSLDHLPAQITTKTLADVAALVLKDRRSLRRTDDGIARSVIISASGGNASPEPIGRDSVDILGDTAGVCNHIVLHFTFHLYPSYPAVDRDRGLVTLYLAG